VSADRLNDEHAGLAIVVPMTTRQKGIRLHVQVDPPEGGLQRRSFVKPEDIRSVSIDRLARRRGTVTAGTLSAVETRLRVLVEL
jgi:mRNA interferase MazF